MSKTYTYYIPTGADYYSEQTDETFCEETEYDYQVSDDEIKNAILDIVYELYFDKCALDDDKKKKIKKSIAIFLDENDLIDTLVDNFDNDLKDYFEEEAIKSARN